jgi:hypothetical protein
MDVAIGDRVKVVGLNERYFPTPGVVSETFLVDEERRHIVEFDGNRHAEIFGDHDLEVLP